MLRRIKGFGHVPTEMGAVSSFNKTGPETDPRRVEEERADMEWDKFMEPFRSSENGFMASRELRERLAKHRR